MPVQARIPYLPLVLLCIGVISRAGAVDADLQAVAARIVARLQGAAATVDPRRPAPVDGGVLGMATALGPDGRWSDIRYDDRTHGAWSPGNHVGRLVELAKAWSAPGGGLHGDPRLASAIHRGLDWWLTADPQCPNWWYNQIRVPQCMGQLLLLLGSELDASEHDRALAILARARIGMTGQNRVWLAGNALMQAIVRDDPQLARQARDAIDATIVIDPGDEGLQADCSFHQHGPQLQSGNYGLAFASDSLAWVQQLAGTGLAIGPEKTRILRDFVLQGLDPLTWNGRLDISACGRQLFPGSPASKGAAVGRQVAALAEADPLAAPDCRKALLAYGGMPAPEQRQTGNRMYWRSDLMVDRRQGYYASVRMSSPRVIGTEVINQENLRGAQLGDGALFLYRSAHEYDDIFPVWDWSRLPGVTASERTRLLPSGKRNAGVFTGGASDGRDGVACLSYDRELAADAGKGTGRTRADKAWFFFAGRIACLGSGIASTLPGTLRTGVEQRLCTGPVMAADGAEVLTLPAGMRACRDLRWAWHDGVGYVFPGGAVAAVGGAQQHGSWREVYVSGAAATVEREVFSLWIDHGSAADPAAATYAYVVLPGMGADEVRAWSAQPDLAILANTPDLQAVRFGAEVGAVFRRAGSLAAAPGGALTVDQPCAVLVGAEGAVTVADPSQSLPAVSLSWRGRTARVVLPDGQRAGSSVAVAWGP